jgi:hypothetical protein
MPKTMKPQKPAPVTITFTVTPEAARLARTIPAQDTRTGKTVVPDLNEMAKFVLLAFVRERAKLE